MKKKITIIFISFLIVPLFGKTLSDVFTGSKEYFNDWIPLGPDVGKIFVWQLKIHPDDRNILFVVLHETTDSSATQIYRSNNGGNSWEFFITNLYFITAMVIDPKNPSLFYLVGNEHVYKSFDGGITWDAKYLIDTVDVYISDIFISSQNSETIYMGGNCEIPRQVMAFYKSKNGGETWKRTQVSVLPLPYNYATSCFAVDPNDENIFYIGGAGGVFPGAMFRSINEGFTWEDISDGLERAVTAMAIDPDYSQNIYVSTYYRGIYRSNNGGSTWIIEEELNDYVYDLAIDPQNTNIIYGGGYRGTCFKSIDGGITWPRIGRGMIGNCMDIEVDPVESNIVYGATTEGFYKSLDSGANWFSSGLGLVASDINAIAIAKADPQTIYIAVQEKGLYKTSDGGLSWESLTNSPPKSIGSLLVHPNSADTVYALDGPSGGDAPLYKTEDGGLNWHKIDNYLEEGYGLALDPHNPNIIYTAGCYETNGTDVMAVCKSLDGGISWSRFLLNSSRSEVYALAIHPKDSNIIFAGGIEHIATGEIGKIYKSTNGGMDWTDVSSTLINKDNIFSLALDPLSTDIVYASGFSGIYKSSNAGANWDFLYPGKPWDVIEILIDPNNPLIIYAATKGDGVYVSIDNGVTWSTINSGLLSTEIECMALDSNSGLLYAGTAGRGVFRLEISTLDVKPEIQPELPGEFVLHQNYPNPFNAETTILYELPRDTKVTLSVYNMLGQTVCTLLDEKKSAGSYSLNWNGNDSSGNSVVSGVYLYSIQTTNFIEVKKMVLLR
jgi:photosystem II stability/assembly factor-like uncharacterized protein